MLFTMQLPPIGVFATLLLLPFSVTAGTVESLRHCKCQPNLPCWPSDSDWQKFNSTVGGMLIADIRPISSACYEGTPEYNKARCDEVTKEFGDSFWRANQPGAVQHTNWETYPPLKESCYLPSSLSNKTGDGEQCKQGSVPRYAVRARNANDISAAVKFAAKHSIPVVIKNTGHDFLGRASRRNALLIWTHFMRDISFENQYGGWEPAGCKGDKYKENELLVRAEAGVMVFELTKEVSKKGRTVVAGAASTVGVVGGFIQGGGHSPLGVWKGLASDHAVEFEVVLADGSIVSASACNNPDLFWALRGGGGSTYGIVTSVVLRTHEDVSMVQYGLNVTIPILPNNTGAANDTFWELVSRWHSMAPAVNDLGGGGYYFLATNFPMPETKITAHLFLAFLFVFGQKDTKEVEKLFNPLHDWLYKTVGAPESGLVSLLISAPEPTMNYLGTLAGTEDGQGNPVILGSRLLSRELLSTPSGVQKATDALRDIEYLGGSIIIGHYVTPGPKPVDSAAHSAWRKAITHIVVGNSWEQGDSFEKQEEIKSLMTDVMVPRLKKLDYDTKTGKQTMGAYVNESDKEELDWQDSFWGEKYGRLKKIKAKYDPNGVFWCRPCVGSEDWDLNGICKVPH